MKQPNIFVLVALALTLGSSVAHSAVNCASVMRNLKAGASPQEVADTMAISLADVKDCQDRDKLDSAGDSGTVLERGGTGDVAPPAAAETEQTGSRPEI